MQTLECLVVKRNVTKLRVWPSWVCTDLGWELYFLSYKLPATYYGWELTYCVLLNFYVNPFSKLKSCSCCFFANVVSLLPRQPALFSLFFVISSELIQCCLRWCLWREASCKEFLPRGCCVCRCMSLCVCLCSCTAVVVCSHLFYHHR